MRELRHIFTGIIIATKTFTLHRTNIYLKARAWVNWPTFKRFPTVTTTAVTTYSYTHRPTTWHDCITLIHDIQQNQSASRLLTTVVLVWHSACVKSVSHVHNSLAGRLCQVVLYPDKCEKPLLTCAKINNRCIDTIKRMLRRHETA